MTPAALALWADADLHDAIADQFSGTDEPFFDKLVAGHRESARIARQHADRLTLTLIREKHRHVHS